MEGGVAATPGRTGSDSGIEAGRMPGWNGVSPGMNRVSALFSGMNREGAGDLPELPKVAMESRKLFENSIQ